MDIFREIVPKSNIAIALGYFDGIHLGHKKIIQTLIRQAQIEDLKTAIITFSSNPANYFNKDKVLNIQSFKDKEIMLEALGIDYLFELDFNKYKDLDAREYLENILIKNFQPKYIITGYNHTFGKNRTGNSNFLKENENNFNYKYIMIPEQKYNETEEVSSTIIRKRISLGHLNAIKSLLNRPFSIRNSVIRGAGLAKKLGYPTVNLVWSDSIVKLPYGVYFGTVKLNDRLLPALISWGNKPTLTNREHETLEAHIYNFNEDLYGKIINISFIKKIRDERKFSDIKELKIQLDKDYKEFVNWIQG